MLWVQIWQTNIAKPYRDLEEITLATLSDERHVITKLAYVHLNGREIRLGK